MKNMLPLVLFVLVWTGHAQSSDFENINFQKADRLALECKRERLDHLPQLVHKLTSTLPTDVERFRAIYRWVCGNIANDYRLYEKNMRKRQRFKSDSLKLKAWNDTFRKLSLRTLMEDQRAICTGYAYLVQEMSKLAGIACEVVHGYARTSTIPLKALDMPNHSWNAVKLNGKWYLCDPTWASGVPNASTFRFEFRYNDGFFLTDPKLFAINHHPVDAKWLLIDDGAPSFEDFLEAPIFYGKAYTNLEGYSEPKKMHNTIAKHQTVHFRCQLQTSVAVEDILLIVDDGNRSRTIHPPRTTIENKALTIAHAFDRNGFYDVHLMIGTDLIATYTFRVKSQ